MVEEIFYGAGGATSGPFASLTLSRPDGLIHRWY